MGAATIGLAVLVMQWMRPGQARVLTLLGADLIVCPANLVTEAWRRVMPARAIENNVYLAVANRAGVEKRKGEELRFKGNSAIYDLSGAMINTFQITGNRETLNTDQLTPGTYVVSLEKEGVSLKKQIVVVR